MAALWVSISLVHKDIAMRRHGCKLYNGDNSHKTLIITEKCDYLRVIFFQENSRGRKETPACKQHSLNFRMPLDK
jgi:hypothetical protein